MSDQWQDVVRRWAASPLDFVLEALFQINREQWKPWRPGTPLPDKPPIGPELWQGNFLDDVAAADRGEGSRWFSVRAGHGVGKSTTMAWVILWLLLFKRPIKIPVTANSQDQLRDVVWAEVALWHRKLPAFLQDMIHVSAERITIKSLPEEAFAVSRTARPEKPEALQGFHCFEAGTVDVLTREGWKPLEHVTTDDYVLTAPPHSKSAEWTRPTATPAFDYDGDLLDYDTRFLDFSVTPNHRFAYEHRQCNKLVGGNTERWVEHVRSLSEMHKGTNRIRKTFDLERADVQTYEIPGCSLYAKKEIDEAEIFRMREQGKTQYEIADALGVRQSTVMRRLRGERRAWVDPITVSMDAWVALLGWFVAEGYVLTNRSGNASSVAICQTLEKNPSKYAAIVRLIEDLGCDPSCGPNQIVFGGRQFGEHVRSLVPHGAQNKRVPQFVFDLSARQIRLFLDAFREGDGTGDRTYYTSSPLLADDLQRLILLAGGYGTINVLKRKGTPVEGLKRSGIRNTDYYRLREYTTRAVDYSYLKPASLKRRHYKGKVHCLTVAPHGMFYVRSRRSSRCFWTHNSANISFMIEEASGIEDVIFQVARGALSSRKAWQFMFGNPTRTSGYFFESHHSNRERWRTYHVPCHHSSRVSPDYARDMARDYGEDSNVYRVRVLGDFPTSEDDAVIPLGLIEAAIGRDVSPAESAVVWGLDVARFGDDSTALAKRRGNVLLEPVREWRKMDLMQTVGAIAKEYRETPIEHRPGAINVDVIGMGGGVVDRLRELGLPVRGINVAERPALDRERYMRLRDELWFEGRDWFDSRSVLIPDDPKLVSELVSPKYKLESSGKLKVESKDEMRKRGVKSPNKADAFLLTMAGGDEAVNRRQPVAHHAYDPFSVGTQEYEREIGRQTTAGTDWSPF
jgi:transcriptional regulator with XRE-family HTH domain